MYPVDIEQVLTANTVSEIKEEFELEIIDLEYTTKYIEKDNLPTGTIQISQEGKVGSQKAITVKHYENDVLTRENILSNNVEKASIDRIVEVGIGKGHNNYKPKEGDTCYVTSNTLAIRLEPDSSSEKIGTLTKDMQVNIIQVLDNWLYITSSQRDGYIEKGAITNINPNEPEKSYTNEYSREELLARLDFNMDLNNPSEFSIEQFKQVLENDSNDKNGVFAESAEYFYYAEQQYNINGVFVAAVGIHESGWGTSTIAKNKNNLFGYGAVDSNPYGGAYSFESYGEGIDLVARVLKKYYLNPAGTEVYAGDVANGRFYNGNTLSAVNKIYASDKNWANSVYKWMKYLYNKLQ